MTDSGLAELERGLARLAARLDYPPAGHLAEAVTVRLRAEPDPTRGWALGWERLRRRGLGAPRQGWAMAAAVFVAVVLAFSTILVVSPTVRDAVADWLGIGGVRITQGPQESLPSPRSPESPTGEFGSLGLGQRVTLEEAADRVGFTLLLPDGLEPDEVFVGGQVSGGQVSLVYRARQGIPEAHESGAGLLLMQFRGEPDGARLDKAVNFEGDGTSITTVIVNGTRGLWIEGEPHLVYFVDERGRLIEDSVRLAGNVLLWEQGGLTLRLESALSLADALRIAESIG